MAMSTADYLDQLRQLLPPGPAWAGEMGEMGEMGQMGREIDVLLQDLAAEFARIERRGDDLLAEMNPATIRELLPDWERIMNLPDACLGVEPLFEARRAAVLQRLIATGSQRLEYFVQLAKSFGYPNATGVEYHAPRMSHAKTRFGKAHFGTWAQQFFWEIRFGGRLKGGRRFGVSVWGERFGANPHISVECMMKRWAPAHLVLRFNYDE